MTCRSLLALLVMLVNPASGAQVKPIRQEALPMFVTLTGTSPTSPRLISLRETGWTFAASGGDEYVMLPGAPGDIVSEFHFVCGSSGSIAIYPFGSDVIEVGDGTSGAGLGHGTGAGGFVTITGAGRRVTVQSAGSELWTIAAGAGIIDWGDDFGVAPSRVRGSTQGLRQAVTLPALSLSTGAASSAPAAHELGLSFANGADHDAPALFVLGADWDDGIEADRDTVSIAIHWLKTTSAAGTVKWQTRYRLASAAARDLSAWSSWTDTSVLASDGNTADRQAIDISDDISVTSTARVPARAIAVQVRRQGSSGSDTYGAAAVLLALQLRYSTDIAGERSDLSK